MILFIVPSPMNKLDLKGRVSGWHFVPLLAKAKEEWHGVLDQVRDKGIERIHASDCDKEAADYAGNYLHLPVSAEFSLRRFNVGRHHATRFDNLGDILERLERQWKMNPDIPIKSGDSLTSFMKRFSRRFNTLLSSTGTALLVTDPMTIAFIRDGMDAHALVPNGNPVNRSKVFKVMTANAGTH
jgi:broad specificity phosphatase PhoE